MVKQVASVDEFNKELEAAGDKLVIVDFFATWCGPCKMIAPKLETMSQSEFSNVVFLKVDVDEVEDLAVQYKVSCMPTFVFIKNKQTVDTMSGANESKIRENLQKHQ